MPRVLVTGAAGFIGSHLCDRLLAHLASSDEEVHKVAQAATLYFLLDDDAESDVHSPTGFHDALEVARAAETVLSG